MEKKRGSKIETRLDQLRRREYFFCETAKIAVKARKNKRIICVLWEKNWQRKYTIFTGCMDEQSASLAADEDEKWLDNIEFRGEDSHASPIDRQS